MVMLLAFLFLVTILAVLSCIRDDGNAKRPAPNIKSAAEEPALAEAEAKARSVFVINEDNSHFYGSRQAGDMTMEGLHAFVDQYAGSAVTHLFLCPNAMRASFRSKTREAIWDVTGDEKMPPPEKGRWPHNARLLHERGLDPYSVWISRCRERGISPWLSMRMNDVHNVTEKDNYMHSTFWRKHPEYWRVPHDKGGGWTDRALNYAHAPVREHNMAFIRELLERYDPDGIELDWMRFGYHLTPGAEREEGHILHTFVREVRALTQEWATKRGHPIRLSVRIPSHPDAAAGLGMDGVAWARDGLVDMLVPCPFWASSDFDIPVELWKQRLGEAARKVVVAPGLEHNARPWPDGEPTANSLGSVYGFAASAWARGADGIYLFNFMDSRTRPVSMDEYRTLVGKGVGREFVAAVEKRFPVCYRDTVPRGFPNGVALPIKGHAGGEFGINIGAKPITGRAVAVFGLAKAEGMDEATFALTVNGRQAKPVADLPSCKGLGGDAARAVQYTVPLAALDDGHNTLAIKQAAGEPEQTIVWTELRLIPTR